MPLCAKVENEVLKLRTYSERELNLPEMWFSGKEWADGTAHRAYRQLYKQAKARLYERDRRLRIAHTPTLPGLELHIEIQRRPAP